jgi:Family of unknown function (DUF6913)
VRIFIKTRESLGGISIRKGLKKISRNRKVHNFKSARTIAVLFDANDKTGFEEIKLFDKFLKELNIQADFLGYSLLDELPSDMILRDRFKLISPKNLDFFQRPKSEEMKAFIQKEYDILIDLAIKRYFVIDYLSSLSVAHFKVGPFREDKNEYDLMIHIEQDPSAGYFIEQIKNYVSIINNSVQ